MSKEYRFLDIEAKWQKRWEEEGAFQCREDERQAKFYCLEMFPYPSGRIHMGHVRNYSIGDVIARFKKMKGYNVLHPIGWDALGLPAENAAIKHGVHPRQWTIDNIDYMRSQLKKMGFSYDWSREISTCEPEYYRWNQWIFLQLYKRGLAYRKKSWVNWCPQCRTVLANEQVINDRCWRCDALVEQKEMEQWFLKITAYAEELLSGHEKLEKWPEHVLTMQKNWIGRSEGTIISFKIVGTNQAIEVFTTRVDTIFGATFLALAPDHPLTLSLLEDSDQRDKLVQWVKDQIARRSLRGEEVEEEKEGIDTGHRAINPYNGEEIPIWIVNYVLMDYGTGAIMAVPAHDARDFEFARHYGLPIRQVIAPAETDNPSEEELTEAFEEYGVLVNSGSFSGLSSREAMVEMTRLAEERGFGRRSILYRLRDWGISRQRYWGTPIPIIYCPECGVVGVPEKDLPVVLPQDVEFKGTEGSPLERVKAFVETNCPQCGGPARRETDTMDTFFDSSWYYFRYCSPEEKGQPFDSQASRYWMPVDLYIGGVEHAILHLIYARFFCKVLRDLGLTEVDEPFPHMLAQGMVTKDGAAMSKSRGNVVDPDEMISQYGADTLRLFILFAAPPEKEFAWNEKGIEGCFRFLNRLWNYFMENLDLFQEGFRKLPAAETLSPEARRLKTKLHQTIKKVTEDIEKRYHLNTAISSIMELFNMLKKEDDTLRQTPSGRHLLRETMEALLLLLNPFAPHISEELWEKTGHRELLAVTPWPEYSPEWAEEEKVTIVVQINGKLRDKFQIVRDTEEELVKEEALKLPKVQKHLQGREPRKIIYIPNKLINMVI
jgi:leucyl-tRNA synthetase